MCNLVLKMSGSMQRAFVFERGRNGVLGFVQ